MPELRLESEPDSDGIGDVVCVPDPPLDVDSDGIGDVVCVSDPPVDVDLSLVVTEPVGAGSTDEPEPESPKVELFVMSAGEARLDTGGPGKVYGELGWNKFGS